MFLLKRIKYYYIYVIIFILLCIFLQSTIAIIIYKLENNSIMIILDIKKIFCRNEVKEENSWKKKIFRKNFKNYFWKT